jgi:hypothetical protein
MTFQATSILLASLSLLAGLLLLRSTAASSPWPDRVRAFLLPPLLLLCVAGTIAKVLGADGDMMNEARLARTFGLYAGVPLYPGRDATGPILGTLHTPLSHIVYWPATLAGDPVTAIRAGVSLSVLLVLLTLSLTHGWAQHDLRRGRGRGTSAVGLPLTLQWAFVLEFFWLVALSAIHTSSIFAVHADPFALACGTLAGGLLLAQPISLRRLFWSACFAILAIAAKQTFAMLPIALGLFLCIADGGRVLLRYCIYLAGWGVAVAAAILALFRPTQDLVFNLWTLATHRPPQPVVLSLPNLHDGFSSFWLRLYQVARHSVSAGSTGRYFVCFLFLLCIWCHLLLRRPAATMRRSLGEVVSENRWLLFLLIALVLFPLLFKASLTSGGAENHLSDADFFLLLGLTTSLLQFSGSGRSTGVGSLPHLIVFALVLLVSSRTVNRLTSARAARPSLTREAMEFSRAHPGVAYFPSNPLASYYAVRRFYSFDHAIFDREIAGYPLTSTQFVSGLPSGVTLIAIDPIYVEIGEVSQSLSHSLNSGWACEPNAELPDFVVYRRIRLPAAAALPGIRPNTGAKKD